MAYDTEFAQMLRRMTRKQPAQMWHAAKCVDDDPLTFAIADGEVMFERTREGRVGFTLTATAAGRTWKKGATAAVILSGGGLLILDKI